MTAMSPSAQAYAEGAVTRTLESLDNKKRPPLQAGMVVTDVDNGDVLAVVGSRNFRQPGFNRAIEAKRPGGSFPTPFVYMLALASPNPWTLASWLDDSALTVTLGYGKPWTTDNPHRRHPRSSRPNAHTAQ